LAFCSALHCSFDRKVSLHFSTTMCIVHHDRYAPSTRSLLINALQGKDAHHHSPVLPPWFP